MILFLWILLIVLPGTLGAGVLTIVYRKSKEYPFSFSDSYLLGFLACIGMTEVMHLLGLLGAMTLSRVGLMLAGVLLPAMILCVIISIYAYLKEQDRYPKRMVEGRVKPQLLIALLGLVGIQALFIYCFKVPITSGDIIPETVQSFLAEDGIYKVLPLTGAVSEQGMPMRYKILCLPTLYAVLSKGFGIEPQLLVCHIIPVVVLAAAYLAYYRLSATLFGREKQGKRFLFLLLVAVVIMVSDRAVFMDGYFALHNGYTGVAIRNLVLVPYTLCAVLERRWWKAVLCILAEASITWTLLGCGVCVVITLGILVLGILGKRLQILKKKEEQT
ncbi:MAG: hypothetical protein IJX63_03720 [Lachnospiraceae bacterium]|nr:hypothetical protein [Lachnospiraceae bacterium]